MGEVKDTHFVVQIPGMAMQVFFSFDKMGLMSDIKSE